MDFIEDNINIKKMYNIQLTELDSNEYEKYVKYLTLFYGKDSKKDKYIKKYLNGKYVLIEKNNPKKKIEIEPAVYINLHILYIKLKEYSDLILFKINSLIETKNNITEENRKEFEDLKTKYIECKKKIDDIDFINKDYYNEIEKLLNKKIEVSNEMIKYHQKRNEEYSKIEVFITESLKNKLIKYFKENKKKIPSLVIINKIAKENKIPSNEIEKWFNWIESVYYYMLKQNEVINLEKEIENKENNYEINTKYMIIKKPIIEE